MQQISKIIAAVPPTDLATVVIERGRAIARLFRGALRLTACVYDPYVAGERFADSADLAAARDALVAARRAELEAVAGQIRAEDGLEVSVSANWAYPVYEGLSEEATRFGADLLVVGTFHHSAAQRLSLTNTDWQLIRRSPCAVLLARRDQFAGYDDILVPVDPMHAHDKPANLDDQLLVMGRTFSHACEARLHVLHCYLTAKYVPLVAPGAAPTLFLDRESPEDRHRAAVHELVGRHGIEPERVHLESGDARQLIPEFADRCGASLVVMGAVSRSRLRRLLIGSTAESVLDRVACDVLVVKPADLPG